MALILKCDLSGWEKQKVQGFTSVPCFGWAWTSVLPRSCRCLKCLFSNQLPERLFSASPPGVSPCSHTAWELAKDPRYIFMLIFGTDLSLWLLLSPFSPWNHGHFSGSARWSLFPPSGVTTSTSVLGDTLRDKDEMNLGIGECESFSWGSPPYVNCCPMSAWGCFT